MGETSCWENCVSEVKVRPPLRRYSVLDTHDKSCGIMLSNNITCISLLLDTPHLHASEIYMRVLRKLIALYIDSAISFPDSLEGGGGEAISFSLEISAKSQSQMDCY